MDYAIVTFLIVITLVNFYCTTKWNKNQRTDGFHEGYQKGHYWGVEEAKGEQSTAKIVISQRHRSIEEDNVRLRACLVSAEAQIVTLHEQRRKLVDACIDADSTIIVPKKGTLPYNCDPHFGVPTPGFTQLKMEDDGK